MSIARARAALGLLVISMAPFPALASWTPSQLDTLAQQFIAGVSSNYQVHQYPFVFLDTSSCFVPGTVCYYSNPDSPYGYPSTGGTTQIATQMSPTDALVLIFVTPPQTLYYGITPYVFSRFYQSVPPNNTPGFVQVFESLGDTTSLATIGTAGSRTPGVNVFSQLSVAVMTADSTTYNQIRSEFGALGFPSVAINQMAMPVNAAPLNMGTSANADTFTMLLRMAYPADPSTLQDYIAQAPFQFMQLSAIKSRSLAALPAPVSKTPGDGTTEPANLLTARDQLVQELLNEYGGSYNITEQTVANFQTSNYTCIWDAQQCNADNSDALYSHDITQWIPGNRGTNNLPEDKLLIVGVNHVLTGKATYINHSIDDDDHEAGVASANNTWLLGTALKMAGITNPSEPRYATYRELYAFMIGYDCSGEVECVTIPQPTFINPVGVTVGNPIDVTARVYLDPGTDTRPSMSEVIGHRVFLLQKK